MAIVSCKEVIRYGNPEGKKVVLLDCGVKNNILRCLLRSGDIEVIRVPWDYDFNTMEYDGLFISNGPGNPEYCGEAVRHIQAAMAAGEADFRHLHGQPAAGQGRRRIYLQAQIRPPQPQPAPCAS